MQPRPKAPIVLDPFGGAGTVALVANRLQRDAVLIEIKPEYIEMAQRRISDDAPLLADVQILKGGETDGKEAHQETETETGARAGVLSKEGAPAGALVA
jgi:tRNA1(Val) A37 N6-methylase TrmN6